MEAVLPALQYSTELACDLSDKLALSHNFCKSLYIAVTFSSLLFFENERLEYPNNMPT